MAKLLLSGGKVIDPGKNQIYLADLLIENQVLKKIAPPGEIERGNLKPEEIIELSGKYLAPGLIDAHLHIESSMLTPVEFSRQALLHGTTAIFVDPHEVANVRKEGIRIFLELAEKLPIDMYVGIPSCVPATHLEDAGAEVSLEDIKELIAHPRAYGLAEMMNFPGIIHGLGDAREKVELVFEKGKIVDGHCPGLSGEALVSYITNGENDGVVRIMSDHESTSYEEAKEKAEKGMFVALRYGSASKDLNNILPELIKNKDPLDRFMLCSDDLEAFELLKDGHIDRAVRRAREIIMENSSLELEQATILAFQLASLNPGRYFERFFKLVGEPVMGRLEPGARANLVVFRDLESLKAELVMVRGEPVVREGKLIKSMPEYDFSLLFNTVNPGREFKPEDFKIKVSDAEKVKVNIIGVIPNSLLTEKLIKEISSQNGELVASPEEDIAKIAVIERHKATGKYALGLVSGLGLKKGAVASTVAHDSHNIIVAGVDDRAMAEAVNQLAQTGGGMIAVGEDGSVFHPLEVAGLMSLRNAEQVAESYSRVKETAKKLGSPLDNIFMTLSFLALPVIPQLKLTNRGLVDVGKFDFVNLIKL